MVAGDLLELQFLASRFHFLIHLAIQCSLTAAQLQQQRQVMGRIRLQMFCLPLTRSNSTNLAPKCLLAPLLSLALPAQQLELQPF
jgi:hypothetical protein